MESCHRSSRRSSKVHVVFDQLGREKSLVAICSEIRRSSGGISKADFEFDICEFESSQGSQPVGSLGASSKSLK